MISTILSYFFKNSSSRVLLICEMSFFKSFSKPLTFFMGGNLLSSSLIAVGIQNSTLIQQKSFL